MSLNPNSTLTLPQKGRVLSILSEEPRAPFHWLAMLEHELGTTISVYTRLSPQRLSQHLNLMKIEFKWLSESMDPHALSPSLERIHHAISTRIVSDSGLIWLDAVEYLIHRQGFDAFLAFTRSLADELNGSETPQSTLVMLSSIGEAALSPAVLSRRMAQWMDMGFDVSSLEQAMNVSPTDRYNIYREVEESVRRAIECERRIQMIEIRGHTVEAAKMRFRIMQLTGLDDVENQLDEILQGERA